ncbi:hypothetical protein [Helicobacter bilis]|uniref:hypothetical protein n=1 Tax=Helicobacter bilis TaxID=37372 RepID=UPI0025A94838|nr:hypothetical protein [Helicobacter bilis]
MKLKDFDFRVWDKRLGDFTEMQINQNALKFISCNERIEIELWSGLYDDKGVKIYENDIVCCFFAMNGLIVFENAMFYVENQHSSDRKTLFEALQEGPFLVERNIHE